MKQQPQGDTDLGYRHLGRQQGSHRRALAPHRDDAQYRARSGPVNAGGCRCQAMLNASAMYNTGSNA